MSQELLHSALEIIELAHLPTLSGWSRKVAELEQHKSNGGKVNDAGDFFVQASRKDDYRLDWAREVIKCLFWTPKDGDLRKVVNAAHLVLAYHCAPRMLEPWPDVLVSLGQLHVRANGLDGWRMPKLLARPAGFYSYKFGLRVGGVWRDF